MNANRMFDFHTQLTRYSAWIAVAVACGFLFGRPDATDGAEDPQSSKELPKPEFKTIVTRDRLNLRFTYWASQAGEESPVLILLHQQDGNRLDWPNSFVLKLQAEGYAVIAPDLRGHGESVKTSAPTSESSDINEQGKSKKGDKLAAVNPAHFGPGDYQDMVLYDMEAIKIFVLQEHTQHKLNMNKTAIIGADMGANVAAYFADLDWKKAPYADGLPGFETPRGQDIRALVLLSPSVKSAGLPLNRAMAAIKSHEYNIAVLIVVGNKDKIDKGDAQKIYTQLAATERHKARVQIAAYDNCPSRGTGLLNSKWNTEEDILSFLESHLKKLSGPSVSLWRERRDRSTIPSPK